MSARFPYLPLVLVLVSGCSLQQFNDAFELPMLEYGCRYDNCGGNWSTGDFARYARMEAEEWHRGSRDVMDSGLPQANDEAPDQPYNAAPVERYIDDFAAVWNSDIHKVEINRQEFGSRFGGYEGAYTQFSFSTPCLDFSHRAFDLIAKSKHMPSEMRVVTIILNDETLDQRGRPRFGYGMDKHAMLLVDGTIYDNGYLTNVPFEYEYSWHYGKEIENVWSPERYR